MPKLKLIWDFRGPFSEKTAEHHLIHLKGYVSMNKLEINIFGVEYLSEMHHLAYLVCEESDMPALRDSLKPHRGQIYQG
ncbi:MAG: hypothetical protein AAGH46_13325 [Bacteroidota bacterium]